MKNLLLYIAFCAIFSLHIHAQTRILVSPNDEIIPIDVGESAIDVARLHGLRLSQIINCSNSIHDGSPLSFGGGSVSLAGFHKDVFGQWFVARYSGTLDTIFWTSLRTVGAFDSTVSIRIFKSNIKPGIGPGNYPYPPPCQPWGYYLNSNDSDMHITPFKDRATDTNWISTLPDGIPTFDPLGEEIWGYGGYTVKNYPNNINFLSLNDLTYKPIVNKGDVFFITMEVLSPNHHLVNDLRTEMVSNFYDTNLAEYSQYYPARNWKFYEHPNTNSVCPTENSDSLKIGWFARGSAFNLFSGGAYNWWYTITTNDNKPPEVEYTEYYDETSGLASVFVDVQCPPLPQGNNQFTLVVPYSTRSHHDTLRYHNLDNSFSIDFPEIKIGDKLCYKLLIEDASEVYGNVIGNCLYSSNATLQNGYQLINNSPFQWIEINDSSNLVLDWFYDDQYPFSTPVEDNGTSGPYDLGGQFSFFGQNVRYAWLGVNGGIALSGSPFDTIHLNRENEYGNWSIPYYTSITNKTPKNYLSVLQKDLLPDTLGHIFVATQGTKFIVQWSAMKIKTEDSLVTFQLVLDRADSSINYLYRFLSYPGDNINTMVGFEADTSHWFILSNEGVPMDRVPFTQSSFKFKPVNPLGFNGTLNIPVKYSLYQNYPNPFNPGTIIHYQLPTTSHLTLKIYNLLGKEVATLINDKKDAGDYDATWDASLVPSGVYFYKLTAIPIDKGKDQFVSIKKMIVIK